MLDPALVARALLEGALQRGARFERASIRQIQPRGNRIEITSEHGTMLVRTAVVCAGAWSSPFLSHSFGLHAPLEAERGYHVELPGHPALIDAPVVYSDHSIVVTPSDRPPAGLELPRVL